MNELQVFKDTEFGELRILTIGGKQYFPATECAKALGYEKPHDAVIRHCRDSVKHGVTDALGRIQQTKFITEGDLYRLIVRSKLPAAERFERWVFDEVLPAIRKYGAYITTDTLKTAMSDPNFLIGLLTELKSEQDRGQLLQQENAKQSQIIGELKPKADYTDWILHNQGLVTITQIAKDYGMSGNQMNRLLNELGIQYKQSDQWLLYREHHSLGYTHSETVNIVHSDGRRDIKLNTKWTQKGRLFIYNLLKEKKGILPTIEHQESA